MFPLLSKLDVTPIRRQFLELVATHAATAGRERDATREIVETYRNSTGKTRAQIRFAWIYGTMTKFGHGEAAGLTWRAMTLEQQIVRQRGISDFNSAIAKKIFKDKMRDAESEVERLRLAMVVETGKRNRRKRAPRW